MIILHTPPPLFMHFVTLCEVCSPNVEVMTISKDLLKNLIFDFLIIGLLLDLFLYCFLFCLCFLKNSFCLCSRKIIFIV